MNTFDITLDLDKRGLVQVVPIRQGDKSGTTIRASIYDHGAAAATSGLTARFAMRLPDGTHYYRKAASLSGNVATVALDEAQAASVAGRTDVAYFQLLQGTTVVASTESFTVVVLPDALADAEVAESYDSAIQDAIDALDAAVEQMPDMVEDVLADHPEWTTTVQDGSITKAKLATDLARDRERLLYRLANMLTAQLPEGDVATATDAAKTPVAGLALYGRSTQDGTPTPSTPVAIQSVTPNLYQQTRKAVGTTYTVSGLTFTYDSTNSATVSGTSTANAVAAWPDNVADDTFFVHVPAGTYTATSSHNVEVKKRVGTTLTTLVTYGTQRLATFTLAEDTDILVVPVLIGNRVDFTGTRVWACLFAGSAPSVGMPYGHAGLWAKRTSDASTYTTTPIDLDGHELRSLPDGTRDEVTVDERGHAVLVQRVGVLTLDGSETWTAENGGARVTASLSPTGIGPASNAQVANLLCDHFVASSPNDTWVGASAGMDISTNGRGIHVSDGTRAMTANGFKTWLAANPTEVLYALATPVTHDLGYVDAVPLVGPDLTAQAVPTASFALEYERDLNATLARLESAIATLA